MSEDGVRIRVIRAVDTADGGLVEVERCEGVPVADQGAFELRLHGAPCDDDGQAVLCSAPDIEALVAALRAALG